MDKQKAEMQELNSKLASLEKEKDEAEKELAQVNTTLNAAVEEVNQEKDDLASQLQKVLEENVAQLKKA